MAKPVTQNDIRSTAQQYVDIHDITNDLLILRDGSVSLILQVNAINFGLLSEPEQDAIIYAYAALINSLSFPIEIVIKSQPKDVSRYLEYVDDQLTQATSELRQRQIAQYRQFVANLITEQNVLDKTFFVVLPLSALELGLIDSLNPLGKVTNNNKEAEFDKYALVEKAKNILIPRRDHMMSQFGRIGLVARQLNTKEIIHLFYTAYNVEAAEGVRVADSREYTASVIQAQGESISPARSNPEGSSNQPSADTGATYSTEQTSASADNSVETAINSNATSPNTTSGTSSPNATSAPAMAPDPADQYTGPQFDSTNDASQMVLENVDAIPQEGFGTPGQPR
jgi:hypothetical protein